MVYLLHNYIARKEGELSVEEVSREYMKLAIEYDNPFGNTKYCLAQIMHGAMETPIGRRLIASKTVRELW